jgi:hypothetical protein
MELHDLKTLAAASLLSGVSVERRNDGSSYLGQPSAQDIAVAVKVAQLIWEEVLEQERTD